MLFDTVAIVGVGLIGGSVGLALKRRRLARRVVGVGRRAEGLRRAKRLNAIDLSTTRLDRGAAEAEITIFCTPVDVIADQAREAARYCPSYGVLTDAGSTKARIVERLETGLPPGVSFVGAHPLAGSEKRGVEQAHPDLFAGRVCVVTPTARTPPVALAAVESLWRAIGSRVVRMTAEAHDRALAHTSHLPHLAAAALSVALPEQLADLTASGFRDTTRIAASDPDLWTAIFLENAGPLLESLAGYEKAVADFRRALEQRNARRLRELWAASKSKRDIVGCEPAGPGQKDGRAPKRRTRK